MNIVCQSHPGQDGGLPPVRQIEKPPASRCQPRNRDGPQRAITRKSASNLALAFVVLPRAKRDAMSRSTPFAARWMTWRMKNPLRSKRAAPGSPNGAPTCGVPVKINHRSFP